MRLGSYTLCISSDNTSHKNESAGISQQAPELDREAASCDEGVTQIGSTVFKLFASTFKRSFTACHVVNASIVPRPRFLLRYFKLFCACDN